MVFRSLGFDLILKCLTWYQDLRHESTRRPDTDGLEQQWMPKGIQFHHLRSSHLFSAVTSS